MFDHSDQVTAPVKRKRMTNEDLRKVFSYRRHLKDNGRLACEICGWDGDGITTARGLSPVDIHHVVPRSCGGNSSPENLIALCPNHHACAHALYVCHKGKHYGPKTKALFIRDLVGAMTHPGGCDGWFKDSAREISIQVARGYKHV